MLAHEDSYQTESGVQCFEEQRSSSRLTPCTPVSSPVSLHHNTEPKPASLPLLLTLQSAIQEGQARKSLSNPLIFKVELTLVWLKGLKAVGHGGRGMNKVISGSLTLQILALPAMKDIGERASTQAQVHGEAAFLPKRYLSARLPSVLIPDTFKRDSKRKLWVQGQAHTLCTPLHPEHSQIFLWLSASPDPLKGTYL